MIPITAYLTAGALAAGALAGWTLRDWKADADALKAVQSAQKREDAARDAVQARADEREKAREANQTQLVRDSHTIREIVKNGPPIPADCAASADVRRVLDDAVTAANAASAGQPRQPMPADRSAAHAADRP